ncbi:hypothetical protein C5167_009730 [Papaver somniferum]|uniref:Uncharacterized protein n=1 Tax=Papaver somniferum TaxID=3469 RepID=A0A4Y7JZD4_PAPSO|nr:hypothetical protein C5167_009730 [Papaver somniferum]
MVTFLVDRLIVYSEFALVRMQSTKNLFLHEFIFGWKYQVRTLYKQLISKVIASPLSASFSTSSSVWFVLTL